jgi:hypothetical protein
MTTISKWIAVVCICCGAALVAIGQTNSSTVKSGGDDLRGRGAFGLHGFEAGCTMSCEGIPGEECWICDQKAKIHNKQKGTSFKSANYTCPEATDGICSTDPPGPPAAVCNPGFELPYPCNLTIEISTNQ